jgi:hypothetical protein
MFGVEKLQQAVSELFGIFTSFFGIYTSSAYFTESQNGHMTSINWT